MDALIAKKIFNEDYSFNKIFKDYVRPWAEDPIAFETCPHFSTDISKAWQVVEKIINRTAKRRFSHRALG